MLLKNWDEMPLYMHNESVSIYYNRLKKRKTSLLVKRIFDVVVSFILLVLLSPLLLVIAVVIKCDSKGPVFFRQRRVTAYKRMFRIYKFRTMVDGAERIGSQVTVKDDNRVTKVGKFLRKFRLDEVPQLINILKGEMSFVGTRPEVLKYVDRYDDIMKATLLMPAGVTSLASIKFKDEEKLLENKENVDDVYVKEVLPLKMRYNLEYLSEFSFWYDIKLLFKTIVEVIK